MSKEADKIEGLLGRFLAHAEDCAVVLVNDNGRIIGCNRGMEKIFGYAPPDLVGKDFAQLFTPEQVQAGLPVHEMEKAAGEGTAAIEGWRLRKDGSRFFASGLVCAVMEGYTRRYVKLIRDTTESRRAHDRREEELENERIARAAAEAETRINERLLSTVTHELRTPLTAIMLWARILRGEVTPDVMRQAIETIERSAQVQGEMIEDLLDSSRLVAGKAHLNIRPMDMTAVAAAAVSAAEGLAEAKDIRLETDFDPHCGSVHADPVRMQQVIWNLLAHSLRAAKRGGHVKLSLSCADQLVKLVVFDEYRDLSPAAIAHLFQGVEKAEDGAHRRSGGLGMAIARQLIEMHGGAVTAHSSPGQGATITVELPLEHDESERQGQRTAAPAGGAVHSQSLTGKRIVLVEDQADTRNVIRWLLEQNGAEVWAVESAQKAVALLQSPEGAAANVLVSDIGMAGEDGVDLIRKIRKWEIDRGSKITMPAIAITAYSGEVERRRALRLGFDAFMAKPIDAGELVTWIAGSTSRPM